MLLGTATFFYRCCLNYVALRALISIQGTILQRFIYSLFALISIQGTHITTLNIFIICYNIQQVTIILRSTSSTAGTSFLVRGSPHKTSPKASIGKLQMAEECQKNRPNSKAKKRLIGESTNKLQQGLRFLYKRADTSAIFLYKHFRVNH